MGEECGLLLELTCLPATQVNKVWGERMALCGVWLPTKSYFYDSPTIHRSPWLQVVSRWCSTHQLSQIAGCVACAARLRSLNNWCLLMEALILHQQDSTVDTHKDWSKTSKLNTKWLCYQGDWWALPSTLSPAWPKLGDASLVSWYNEFLLGTCRTHPL